MNTPPSHSASSSSSRCCGGLWLLPDAAGIRNPMDARFALEGVKTACSGGGDKEEAAAMARALVVSQGGLDSMAGKTDRLGMGL